MRSAKIGHVLHDRKHNHSGIRKYQFSAETAQVNVHTYSVTGCNYKDPCEEKFQISNALCYQTHDLYQGIIIITIRTTVVVVHHVLI